MSCFAERQFIPFAHSALSGKLQLQTTQFQGGRATRVEASQDVFDYIEMFYNSKRKHVRNGMLSPVEFEWHEKMKPSASRKFGAIQMSRSVQQQAQGRMSEHPLVHESCRCPRKAGGLA